MSNTKEYEDIIAFHPGYYIADTIRDMGISQEEFAQRLGTTAKTVSTLVNGQSNISCDLAKKLSLMLGTSTDLWLNLQKNYDEKLIEIEKKKDFEQQEEILSEIDYSYFVRVAQLPETEKPKEKIENLCHYLMISNLQCLKQSDYLVNFRTGISKLEEKNRINSRAWLQTALNFASQIQTEPFQERKLKSYLPELRGMTVKEPQEFLPRMKEIFAECGVAFVVLPNLKNSGINGAVRWVNRSRVVLAMNNRGLYADRFWFSLFHEIKHVLQQKIKKTFVSTDLDSLSDYDRELEKEADEFSQNYLIPKRDLESFAPDRFTTDEEIIAFARKIGIHPGIVAGRLQHDKVLPENRCSRLKEKYFIDLI